MFKSLATILQCWAESEQHESHPKAILYICLSSQIYQKRNLI